jgi:hypothetical protein
MPKRQPESVISFNFLAFATSCWPTPMALSTLLGSYALVTDTDPDIERDSG